MRYFCRSLFITPSLYILFTNFLTVFVAVSVRSKINTTKLLSDLGEWERRMRLREYFYKADDEDDDNNYDKDVRDNF